MDAWDVVMNNDISRLRPLINETNINNQRYGETLLHVACRYGLTEIAYFLLSFPNIDVNLFETHNYLNPLHYASLYGHIDIVKLLLKHPRVNLNKVTPEWNTALHLASESGHLKIVEILLDSGFKKDEFNNYNETAYDVASTPEIRDLILHYDIPDVKSAI